MVVLGRVDPADLLDAEECCEAHGRRVLVARALRGRLGWVDSRERMGERVEVGESERRGEQARFVRGVGQSTPAEEASAVRDVERAQLGGDRAHDREPEAADVR